MKTCALATVWLVLTGIACFGSGADPATPIGTGQMDLPIVSKLRQLVAIRERQAGVQHTLAEAGRASGESAAAVALAEARIELARELGQREVVLVQLQDIVQLRRDWLATAKSKGVDRVIEMEVIEAEAALLQAEVRLLREQKRWVSEGK